MKNSMPTCDFCGIPKVNGEQWVWFQEENRFFCSFEHQSHFEKVMETGTRLGFAANPEEVNILCSKCSSGGRIVKLIKSGHLTFEDHPGKPYDIEIVSCPVCSLKEVL